MKPISPMHFCPGKRKQELKSHMKQNAFNKVLNQYNDSLNTSNIKVNSPPPKILELQQKTVRSQVVSPKPLPKMNYIPSVSVSP